MALLAGNAQPGFNFSLACFMHESYCEGGHRPSRPAGGSRHQGKESELDLDLCLGARAGNQERKLWYMVRSTCATHAMVPFASFTFPAMVPGLLWNIQRLSAVLVAHAPPSWWVNEVAP